VPTCPRQAGVHGRVLAEVAFEPHRAHAWVTTVETLQHGERPVGRAVVDEDQLEGAEPGLERGERAAVELLERVGFVVKRDDDRYVRGGKLRFHKSGCRPRLRVSHATNSIARSLLRGTR